MSQTSKQLNASRKVASIGTISGKVPAYRTSLSKTNHLQPATGPVKKVKKPWQAMFAGSPVLILVIILHLLFAAIAAYLIVSSFSKERKKQFTEAPPTANPPHKEVEHNVQMAKKKVAMTTPEVMQRIAAITPSPVTLPEVDMPTLTTSTAIGKMQGVGMGGGGGGGHMEVDAQVIAASVFGSTDRNSPGLEGTFYDLATTAAGTPSGLAKSVEVGKAIDKTDMPRGLALLEQYMGAGWPDGFFDGYFKASTKIYTSQIMTPYIPSEKGPEAFGHPEIPAIFWIVVYQGRFKVDKEANYRFVGYADAFLEVNVDGEHVLEGSWEDKRGPWIFGGGGEKYSYTLSGGPTFDFKCGHWMHLDPDKPHEIKILIGDQGGVCGFWLMVEEQGRQYALAGKSPILPPFKISDIVMPSLDGKVPPLDMQTKLGWSFAHQDSGDDLSK